MNLNLGAGPNWKNEGWHILDHKISKNEGYKIKGNLNDINLKDQSCDLIFISHTLEHIPHIQIQNVLTEINRIMKFGSTIRILVPNLYKLPNVETLPAIATSLFVFLTATFAS